MVTHCDATLLRLPTRLSMGEEWDGEFGDADAYPESTTHLVSTTEHMSEGSESPVINGFQSLCYSYYPSPTFPSSNSL